MEETTYRSFYRKTPPFLTRYERAKVLAVRAEQLSIGQLPRVEIPDGNMSHLDIAWQELRLKTISNCIVRTLPSGATEVWAVKDLINLYD